MAAVHCARLGHLHKTKVHASSSVCFPRQVAMATGQVLFHRFFYSKSFVKHSFEVSPFTFSVADPLSDRCLPGNVSIA